MFAFYFVATFFSILFEIISPSFFLPFLLIFEMQINIYGEVVLKTSRYIYPRDDELFPVICKHRFFNKEYSDTIYIHIFRCFCFCRTDIVLANPYMTPRCWCSHNVNYL